MYTPDRRRGADKYDDYSASKQSKPQFDRIYDRENDSHIDTQPSRYRPQNYSAADDGYRPGRRTGYGAVPASRSTN